MSPRGNLRPDKVSSKVRKWCRGCEKVFYVYPNEAKRGRKFCSRSCMNKREQRECSLCGIVFVVSKKNPREICGKACPSLKVEYDCVVCSITVVRPKCFGLGKFCTDRCHRLWLKDNEIMIEPHHGMSRPVGGSKRKHKIKKGDMIDRQDVFDFFNWTCIICDESIDKNVLYPDKMSATLEHIIPLSRGGTHTWDNVAPAHLLCNGKKGNETMDDVIEKHRSMLSGGGHDLEGL